MKEWENGKERKWGIWLEAMILGALVFGGIAIAIAAFIVSAWTEAQPRRLPASNCQTAAEDGARQCNEGRSRGQNRSEQMASAICSPHQSAARVAGAALVDSRPARDAACISNVMSTRKSAND